MRITHVPLRHARRIYRAVRKRAKRIGSGFWLAGMMARNRFTRKSALGSSAVLVSLTSYAPRMKTVAYTIESIAAGSVRPSRLILWLDDLDAYQRRPRCLRRLESRGLEVRLTTDYGPHKKYYPSLELVQADDVRLVTADDDVFYPRHWLAGLIRAAEEHPEAVNCYRASVLSLSDGAVARYADWPRCRSTESSLTHFATGVSGVIYPPAAIAALIVAGNAFTKRCPRADDIWLHWIELNAGIPVRQVASRAVHFPYIPGSQVQTLVAQNVAAGGNDRWVAGLYRPEDVAALLAAGAAEIVND